MTLNNNNEVTCSSVELIVYAHYIDFMAGTSYDISLIIVLIKNAIAVFYKFTGAIKQLGRVVEK